MSAPESRRALPISRALFTATAIPAQGSKHLFTHKGASTGAGFGMDVAGIGDVNRDGHADYAVQEKDKFAHLVVDLKYDEDGNDVIREIKRVSTPGCRKYRGVDDLPDVLGGLGIAVLSTNRGVISDRKAREMKIGGEVLCTVY